MYILNVEDDLGIQEVISEVLRYAGYEVETANNGQQALDRLQLGDYPKLILLDIMMPVLDGWQVMDLMGKDESLCRIPVIVLSAMSQNTGKEKWPNVKKVLQKPVNLDDLLSVIHEVVQEAVEGEKKSPQW